MGSPQQQYQAPPAATTAELNPADVYQQSPAQPGSESRKRKLEEEGEGEGS
jgi:hypothetical protein